MECNKYYLKYLKYKQKYMELRGSGYIEDEKAVENEDIINLVKNMWEHKNKFGEDSIDKKIARLILRSKGLNEYQKFRYTDISEHYGIKNVVLNMFNVKSIDHTEEYNNNLDKVKVVTGNKVEYIDIKDVRNKKYDDLRFMNFYVKQNKYKLGDDFLYSYNFRTCSFIGITYVAGDKSIIGYFHMDAHYNLKQIDFFIDFLEEIKRRIGVEKLTREHLDNIKMYFILSNDINLEEFKMIKEIIYIFILKGCPMVNIYYKTNVAMAPDIIIGLDKNGISMIEYNIKNQFLMEPKYTIPMIDFRIDDQTIYINNDRLNYVYENLMEFNMDDDYYRKIIRELFNYEDIINMERFNEIYELLKKNKKIDLYNKNNIFNKSIKKII
jgi:hypothetical protein